MMTIFAKAAIYAVNIINDQNLSPEEAWFKAISTYTKSYETRIKQCPKYNTPHNLDHLWNK